MNKITCVVSCPLDSYSGYGVHSRQVVKSLIQLKPEWDIKILNQNWGTCQNGYLENHNELNLKNLIINNLTHQPDIWIQITVAHEFQRIGKQSNILITALSETNIVSFESIEGCNRADYVIVPSKFNKDILEATKIEKINNYTGQKETITINKPIHIIHEGIDIDMFKKTNDSDLDEFQLASDLDNITEEFLFLFNGSFIARKNIESLIFNFLNTFKNNKSKPALLLKTNGPSPSIIDKEKIKDTINNIQKQVNGLLPNIYLLHGEFTDSEINCLYNHPKVKCMVSLTKGESYGLPLAEFSTTGKPIIASNWSGHLDFLHKENCVLIGGELKPLMQHEVMDKILIKESSWFYVNEKETQTALESMYKNYNKYLQKSQKQINYIKNNFSFNKMVDKFKIFINEQIEPKLVKFVPLTLPNFKKLPTLNGK